MSQVVDEVIAGRAEFVIAATSVLDLARIQPTSLLPESQPWGSSWLLPTLGPHPMEEIQRGKETSYLYS